MTNANTHSIDTSAAHTVQGWTGKTSFLRGRQGQNLWGGAGGLGNTLCISPDWNHVLQQICIAFSEFSKIYSTFIIMIVIMIIIIIQCCYIVPIWVSWIGKIRGCDQNLAPPLAAVLTIFAGRGRMGPQGCFLWQGGAWNPPFPGGRVPWRPSLVQPHADFIKDVPMHCGVRLIARKRVIYWHWAPKWRFRVSCHALWL